MVLSLPSGKRWEGFKCTLISAARKKLLLLFIRNGDMFLLLNEHFVLEQLHLQTAMGCPNRSIVHKSVKQTMQHVFPDRQSQQVLKRIILTLDFAKTLRKSWKWKKRKRVTGRSCQLRRRSSFTGLNFVILKIIKFESKFYVWSLEQASAKHIQSSLLPPVNGKLPWPLLSLVFRLDFGAICGVKCMVRLLLNAIIIIWGLTRAGEW